MIAGSNVGHRLQGLDDLAEQAAGKSNGGGSEPKHGTDGVIRHNFHPSFLSIFDPTSSLSFTDTLFFSYVYLFHASSCSQQYNKDIIQLV